MPIAIGQCGRKINQLNINILTISFACVSTEQWTAANEFEHSMYAYTYHNMHTIHTWLILYLSTWNNEELALEEVFVWNNVER